MSLTAPTDAQLAAFMGVEVAALDPYHDEALLQATDLMMIAVDQEAPSAVVDPTDSFTLRIVVRGICAMAEWFIVGRATRAAGAVGFRHEVIGSYEYDISLTKIRAGADTGVSWFDQAVSLMGGDLEEGLDVAGVHIFDRDVNGIGQVTGDRHFLGPDDESLVVGSYHPVQG